MRINCPGCYQASDNIDPDLEGCIFRCNSCGTEWMARGYNANPYTGSGFQGRLEQPPAADEGLLIDYGGTEFDNRGSDTITPAMARATGPGWTRGRVTAALLAVLAAMMMAKVPIVAALPDGGPDSGKISSVPAGNDLLRFDRVRGEHDTVGGANHLIVVGDVVNPTRSTLALPSVRVALRDADGREIRSWRIDLARSAIKAGETIHFRSAVAASPRAASDVKLTMVPRLNQSAERL